MLDASATSTSQRGRFRRGAVGYVPTADAWDRREMRKRKALGFYVSGDPLERYL